MNFNQLNNEIKKGLFVFASVFFLWGCNDEKSANYSTPLSTDTDTTTTTTDPQPVVAKKKSGKVSTSMSADNANAKMEKDKMGYYNRTDVVPAYNGGQSGMENYIINAIEYPQDAIDNNAEGIVNVQFGVDENGNISNVSTIGNKIGYGLEEEAIRVVSKMPKWVPGQVKGKNVKTWRTLPINYRLEEN